jgi:hypothetical protein
MKIRKDTDIKGRRRMERKNVTKMEKEEARHVLTFIFIYLTALLAAQIM